LILIFNFPFLTHLHLSSILFYISDVGKYHILQHPKDSTYSSILTIPYPKVGTSNPSVRVGVITISNTINCKYHTVWLQIPGSSSDNYISRVHWADSNDELLVQQLNRLQNSNHVMMVDRHTGKANLIFEDNDTCWVESNKNIQWIGENEIGWIPKQENNKSPKQAKGFFTFVSERSGWRHIYLISRNGGTVIDLTPGEFDVIEFYQYDTQHQVLYFLASPSNRTQRYLYVFHLSTPLQANLLVQLTPQEYIGCSSYSFSPLASYGVWSFSTFASPSTFSLISLPTHTHIVSLESNKTLHELFCSLNVGTYEFLKVPTQLRTSESFGCADGSEENELVLTDIDCWMIYPPQFNIHEKYPVIVYVYGEPAAQTVLDQWAGYRLWHTYLSQLGYVVVSIENRGTPAPRGRQWRKSVYGLIGTVAPDDQYRCLKELVKKFTFLDEENIGIWGWSGGGSMSLNAIFRYPDLYKTAVSIAFVSNQLYYDTIYQVCLPLSKFK
jgi:dipeptidyl-peptidase 4